MKRFIPILAVLWTIFVQAQENAGETIHCAHDLALLHPLDRNFRIQYEFEAQVVCAFTNSYRLFMVQDATGCACMANHHRWPDCGFSAGDTVRVAGFAYSRPNIGLYIAATNVVFIRRGDPPSPEEVNAVDIIRGGSFPRFVRLTGIVRDLNHDDIDNGWSHLLMTSGGESVYAFICQSNAIEKISAPLRDAEISLIGISRPSDIGKRRFMGPIVIFDDVDAIEIVKPAPADPFDVPVLEDLHHMHALRIADMGRRRTSGRVIATWRKNRILLRLENDSLVKVETDSLNLPPYGACIQVSGIPATDLYSINLTRAVWRKVPARPAAPEPQPKPAKVSAGDILRGRSRQGEASLDYQGKTIRLAGIVRALPPIEDQSPVIMMECDGHLIPVDASGCPAAFGEIDLGCEIEASGVCVMDVENWQPNRPIPQIEGFRIALRTPSDMRILARPPFWTPSRLMMVIGALVAALGGIFIWNRMLNHMVERRSRALMRERIAHDEANLKTEERMRLAVELHDTLAQNLTGISLQIDAAQMAAEENPNSVMPYLETARRKMQNCRENLRNCLWDLRSRAFEERDLSEAIRKTIAPHVGGADFDIDMDIPCRKLSDNTIHAVLCIIRELAINAIRHGKARHIMLSGAMQKDSLSLTFRDDGTGFDTASRPGMSEGHFGLQGISERVRRLGGRFDIESSLGNGTTAKLRNLSTDT